MYNTYLHTHISSELTIIHACLSTGIILSFNIQDITSLLLQGDVLKNISNHKNIQW